MRGWTVWSMFVIPRRYPDSGSWLLILEHPVERPQKVILGVDGRVSMCEHTIDLSIASHETLDHHDARNAKSFVLKALASFEEQGWCQLGPPTPIERGGLKPSLIKNDLHAFWGKFPFEDGAKYDIEPTGGVETVFIVRLPVGAYAAAVPRWLAWSVFDQNGFDWRVGIAGGGRNPLAIVVLPYKTRSALEHFCPDVAVIESQDVEGALIKARLAVEIANNGLGGGRRALVEAVDVLKILFEAER